MENSVTLTGGMFGVFVYVYSLAALFLCTAFMINRGPYKIDRAPAHELYPSLAIDVVLAGFFALPNRIFARPAMKKEFGDGPHSLYRTMYVMQGAVAIMLICVHWQAVWVDIVVWDFTIYTSYMLAAYGVAFVWFLTSTFAADHFELLGLTQSCGFDIMNWLGIKAPGFTTRWHYSICRHPIETGLFGMLFLVPRMTANHLFFSVTCAVYMLLAVRFLEEPDMLDQYPEYRQFMKETPSYCPFGGVCASLRGSGRRGTYLTRRTMPHLAVVVAGLIAGYAGGGALSCAEAEVEDVAWAWAFFFCPLVSGAFRCVQYLRNLAGVKLLSSVFGLLCDMVACFSLTLLYNDVPSEWWSRCAFLTMLPASYLLPPLFDRWLGTFTDAGNSRAMSTPDLEVLSLLLASSGHGTGSAFLSGVGYSAFVAFKTNKVFNLIG